MTAMGIPSTFILGPDRALIDRAVGYSPDVEERWKKVIEKHLQAAQEPGRPLGAHHPHRRPSP